MRVASIAVVALAMVLVVGATGWIADATLAAPPATTSAFAPEVTSGTAGQSLPPSLAGLKILFSAEQLGPSGQSEGNGIFEMNSDGSDLQTLLSSDSDSTVTYNWPEWALGGTKIVFTERTGPSVSSTDPNPQYENLWEMNADGTDLQQLTYYDYRAVQPKMSADGTSVLFAAENPQYQRIGVYRLNLLTLQATNVSEVTQPLASFDSDPNWTPSGGIIMSSSEQGPGIEIDEMNSDGTNRQEVVSDGKFNTDAVASPSGNEIAYSAFDGADPVAPGYTLIPSDPDDTPLNPQGWFIKVHNLSTGSTSVLNQGEACNGIADNCQPEQSSGWQPIWSPDGRMLAWTGRISATTECICVANADGSEPISLISTHNLIIKWIDWIAPDGQVPPTAVTGTAIGSQAPHSKLLLSSMSSSGGGSGLLEESPDMMTFAQLPTGEPPNPAQGRFSSDRSEYVFTASASYNPNEPQYGPPPPPGQQVHGHFTLEQIHPGLLQTYTSTDISPEEQVFLHTSSGRVIQLTTPWTEDWQDAIDPGDDRSNTDPVLSPNGQYVVFTNHSTLTGESFLLRMDLQTGSVLNLTNGTAGALEVNDSLPEFSPDGSKIAFTWTDGSTTDVYVMNTADGKVVTEITDDNAFDMDPTWSPDGQSIVYSHYNGVLEPTPAQEDSLSGLPQSGWSLVKINVATGAEQVLTQPSDSPTFRPVYSPDGTQIDFIGDRYGFLGLFKTTPDGAPVQPVLVDAQMSVAMVDWK